MNTQIYEEASTWFVDLRAGDVDAGERRRFDTWVRKSPEHLRAYLEITEIWQDAPFVAKEGGLSVATLLTQARAATNVISLTPSPAPRGRAGVGAFFTRRRSLAASIGFLILAIAAYFTLRTPTYATDTGEQRLVTLDDGSTVELNARSKIRVSYTQHGRNIALLAGQALFSVNKDAARPFIVTSDTAQIRALGTRFDVYKKSTGTVVTVVEGRVAILPSLFFPLAPEGGEGRGEGVSLIAGEQLTVTAQPLAKPQKANISTATAWTQRRLVFDDSPLPDVVEEFNRYNARQFTVTDAKLAEFHISGVYASTDPALLLRFLREQPTIEVSETDKEIRISRK